MSLNNSQIDAATSPAELLHAREEYARDLATKSGAGQKAGITGKINRIEFRLVMLGQIPGTVEQVKDTDHPATFTAWDNPNNVTTTRTPYSSEDAVRDIAGALRIMFENMPGLDTRYPDSFRATADKTVTESLKKCAVRDVVMPDPRVNPADDATVAWTRTDTGEYALTDRPDGKVWARREGVSGPSGNALKNAPRPVKDNS